MNTADELEENSDTSDEDYVPDEKKSEVLSEVDSDGDPEDSLSENEDKAQKSGKRKRTSGKSRKKQKKSEETINSSNEIVEEVNEEEKKKKEDDLWADFMKDTGFQSKKSVNSSVSMSKVNATPIPKTSSENKPNLTNKRVEEKVKITQIFEFAGEEVTVEKEVSVNSAEARLLNKSGSQTNQDTSKRKGGLSGIGAILNQLGKKPKISTLEKSKLDWDRFKKEENLEEELQNHNKGRDGYLEKQDFLQRADLRRFEIEKEVRTVERNRRMNNSL